jgi:hypothetical protein
MAASQEGSADSDGARVAERGIRTVRRRPFEGCSEGAGRANPNDIPTDPIRSFRSPRTSHTPLSRFSPDAHPVSGRVARLRHRAGRSIITLPDNHPKRRGLHPYLHFPDRHPRSRTCGRSTTACGPTRRTFLPCDAGQIHAISLSRRHELAAGLSVSHGAVLVTTDVLAVPTSRARRPPPGGTAPHDGYRI